MRTRSGPSDDADDRSRARAQSDIVGMVVLIGVIVVAALLTIAVGGMALQSVQDSTEWEATQDTAIQAHTVLSEAASTGEPQELPTGDGAVDTEVVEGGTLTISMQDGSDTCSQQITEDLGALRYEGGDGAMIYEGGAVWSETDGGLGISEAPPISHGPEGTTVSVLSVSAATTTSGQLVAEPNASERKRLSDEIDTLLTACPAGGYTDLKINVTSPYHEGWAEHFEQSVATTSNVTVTQPTEESVVATIDNATDPITVGGLGIKSVEAPTVLAPGDDFSVETEVANDAFDDANATIELDVGGTNVSRNTTLEVGSFATGSANFTLDAATLNDSFTQGTTYDYAVTVHNESGASVSTATGSVTFGMTAPMVSLADVEHSLANGDDDLTVTATLENVGLQNGTGSVALNLTDPSVDAPTQSVGPVDVAGGGETQVAFELNVSGLAAGHYEYAVSGPNGSETRAFTIADRADAGSVVGDLRISDVNASATRLEAGDDFESSVSLENLANETVSGDLSLDVAGLPAESTTVSLAPGDSQTATLQIDGAALGTLEAGQTHDYDVTLESDGETEMLSGSVYLGESGSDLGVDSVNATVNNGSATITATLDNDGLANGTDDATLSMTGPDGSSVDFESTPQQSVTTRWGSTGTVSFALDVSSLGGNHTFTVAYGDETDSGTLELSALDQGDDGVAISGGGEGTVTVLGTEISAEWWEEYPSEMNKRWAPTGVSVIQETDGTEEIHRFENEGGDVENEYNLNSYDTQEETYTYSWEQSADESTTITLRSTYWNEAGGNTIVNQRTEDDVTWNDYQPSNGIGSIARRVNANANQNAENVQVLTDGDKVPQVSGVLPDQRNASEVLNQGAADRINPETNELTLDPNEAVFLFEMTTTTEQVDGDMWEYALEHDDASDPDFNDVIAIVEFEPDGGSVPVEMNTTDDGSGLVIGTPSVSSGGGGSASIGDVETTDGDGATDGAEPEAPGTGVGQPSPPDDVSVEVDVVQID